MKRTVVLIVALLMVTSLFLTVSASEAGKLVIWADETRAPILQEVGTAFQDTYGVPVEVQEIGFGDIRGQLATAAPAGEGPDIIIGAHDWLGELIQNGLIEPIVLPEAVKKEFDPVAIDAFSWGGQLYGLPYATECVALIYNKDLVPEVPATFEDLLTTAKGLTDQEAGEYGFLIQEPDPFHTFALFSAGGGYIFGNNPDGTLNPCDIGLDNAGAIAGATLLDQMVKDGIEVAGADYGMVTGLFNTGKLAMMIGGPWTLPDAQKGGINYGVAPIPAINGNAPKVFVGVQGFMVSAFSENKVLANLFIKDFLVNNDVMMKLYTAGGRPPAYLPTLQQVSGNADIQGFAASAANGYPMPKIPEMGSVWSAWSDALQLIVSQQAEPATVMGDAVGQIKALLKCE
jgi:maltose-binding protein MalE